MRSVVALLALFFGALMVPAATAGWWLRDTIVPESAFVETVAPLAGDPAVQGAVRATLVRETTRSLGAVPGPLAERVERLVDRAAGAVVESDAFVEAWRESNRAAHEQIVGALEGDSAAVGVEAGSTVELRLGPLAAAVRQEVDRAGIPFGGAIPRTDTTYPIGTADDLGRAKTAFALLHDYGRLLPAVTAGLLLLGLAVAQRRGPALAGTAAFALAGLGLLWLAIGSGRELYLSRLPAAVPDAAGAAYVDALADPLRSLTLQVAAGAAVALLLGLLVGAVQSLVTHRR